MSPTPLLSLLESPFPAEHCPTFMILINFFPSLATQRATLACLSSETEGPAPPKCLTISVCSEKTKVTLEFTSMMHHLRSLPEMVPACSWERQIPDIWLCQHIRHLKAHTWGAVSRNPGPQQWQLQDRGEKGSPWPAFPPSHLPLQRQHPASVGKLSRHIHVPERNGTIGSF